VPLEIAPTAAPSNFHVGTVLGEKDLRSQELGIPSLSLNSTFEVSICADGKWDLMSAVDCPWWVELTATSGPLLFRFQFDLAGV
jgi:hypothetical protein